MFDGAMLSGNISNIISGFNCCIIYDFRQMALGFFAPHQCLSRFGRSLDDECIMKTEK